MGVVGIVGHSMMSGCLNQDDNTGKYSVDNIWKYEVGGFVDSVKNGVVFGRGKFGRVTGWKVFGLDAKTGKEQWTYGGKGGTNPYTELTVIDDVYFGWSDDQYGNGKGETYVLDRKGEERWTRDVGGGGRSPIVSDGDVYTTSDDGVVYSLLGKTGGIRWTHKEDKSSDESVFLTIVDVSDSVHVETNHSLLALDRDSGDTLWRYETDKKEQTIINSEISGNISYVATPNQVVAVKDGEELWSRAFEQGQVYDYDGLIGIASNRLLIHHRPRDDASRFQALDITTGEQDWVSGIIEDPNVEHKPQVAISDGVVYVGAKQLRALEVATGDELWSTTVDETPIQSITAVDKQIKRDQEVFIHHNSNYITGIDQDGKITWEKTVNGEIRSYIVGKTIYVGTRNSICNYKDLQT